MTAPLDIGMEQQDAMLGMGQDDMFDLGKTEEDLGNQQGTAALLMDDDGDAIIGSSEEDGSTETQHDEPLDSEDERETKLLGLEAELDGLYDAYQDRLRERDAKFKVKEARRRNAERDEWNGIKAKDIDDEDSDDEEVGGWDKFQEAKLNDQNLSDESSDESVDEEAQAPNRKRAPSEQTSGLPNKKRPRLVSNLKPPNASATTSAAARIWFAQDIFSGLGGLSKHSDSDFEDLDGDKEETEYSEGVQVRLRYKIMLRSLLTNLSRIRWMQMVKMALR
jgi:AdoMet-dependent rRNA methyltransferase SPB1